jgi:hypothetical protein
MASELAWKETPLSGSELQREQLFQEIRRDHGRRKVGNAIFNIPPTERAMDIVNFGPCCNMILQMLFEQGTADEYRNQRDEFVKQGVTHK